MKTLICEYLYRERFTKNELLTLFSFKNLRAKNFHHIEKLKIHTIFNHSKPTINAFSIHLTEKSNSLFLIR